MSRLEQTRQVYSLALEQLYENEQHFADFLRYAGRFYKLLFSHTSTLFHLNPEATMWADYDTWAAFENNVLRGQRSTPALLGGNSRLRHYFDISQTTQAVTPFQWTMDKNVAQEFLSTAEKAENKQYKSIASYINRHVEQLSEEMAEDIFSVFSVPEQDKKAFLNSFCTMAETVVAARCEHNSSYKYKAQGVPDLSALQMLKSPEELERLCGFIHTSAKTVLLDMEKSITKIINLQRSEQNERSRELSEGERETGNDLVRGGTEALSEVRSGREAGDSISAEHGDMDVQPPLGADNGRTGEGAAETADNALRSEVEGVHGGESLLDDTSPYGQLTLGDNTEGDRQRSAGDVSDIGGAVRSSQSQTDRVYGNGEMGEDEAVGDRPYDNDGIGTPVSGITEQNIEAAEISDEVSAVSVSEDNHTEKETPERTVQDAYNEYLPIVSSMVLANEAVINALNNSDLQNIGLECDSAVRSAVFNADSMELTKLYSDNAEFHDRLHSDIQKQIKEKYFMETDLASKMAKSTLAWDEIESLGYIFFEEGYTEKTSPSESSIFGRSLRETEAYELSMRMKNGEDIAKDLTASLFGTQEQWAMDFRETAEVEITNSGYQLTYGDVQRFIPFDELAGSYLTYFRNEYAEIEKYRLEEEKGETQQPVQTSNMVIADFRAKTAELYNPIGKYSPEDIEDIAKSFAEGVFSDNEIEATVGNVILTGSRSRGLETDRSDIDVVIEVDSQLKEDSLFNVLHEELLDIDGITVDINPIRAEETGTLETYLPSAESYLSQKAQEQSKAEQKQPEADQEQRNFSFSEGFSYASGEKGKYNDNIVAIRTLKRIEDEGRSATPEEQQILSKYAGWGGVAKAFDPDNAGWSKEYAELKELLTPDEYAAAKGSVLNAHFTSPEIINAMYKALGNMGVKEGNILEPSMGVGNFFGCLPEKMKDCQLYGVELDSITGRID